MQTCFKILRIFVATKKKASAQITLHARIQTKTPKCPPILELFMGRDTLVFNVPYQLTQQFPLWYPKDHCTVFNVQLLLIKWLQLQAIRPSLAWLSFSCQAFRWLEGWVLSTFDWWSIVVTIKQIERFKGSHQVDEFYLQYHCKIIP